MSPVWVGRDVVLAIHEAQLAEHGGPEGLRDAGLLDSALARAANLLHCANRDIADLAAAYTYGLARNHPFSDGNKRVSLVVTELFLDLNGYELIAGDADCLIQFLGLAEGSVSEDEMAGWIRANISPAA